MALDEHGQPTNRAFNRQRLSDRAIDELLGACRGVAADGHVAQAEAEFLLDWISRNREVADMWPSNVLFPRIQRMLNDKTLDSEEQQELLSLLHDLAGGVVPDEEAAISASSNLPIDADVVVEIPSRVFCLTGRFMLGTRKEVTRYIADLCGTVTAHVTGETDYLVVARLGSRDWIHSTHGRKIEKAIELRDRGCRISIISEQQLVARL